MPPCYLGVFLLLLAARLCFAGNHTQLIKVLYDLEKYPLAVCNDGTAGGFYFIPATNPEKENTWVVILEGGQWCWDDMSCGIRSEQNPQLTTSSIWPPHIETSGIFDSNPHRNPLAGANLVYCSSDAWVGNVGPALQMGWQFRGQAQVEALLRTISSSPISVVTEARIHFLNHTHEDVNTTWTSTPLSPGGRLLFGGCSAGARGALFSIDSIAAFLPPGVALHGFFDSPLWVDVLPLQANITSLENQTQGVYALMNATARLDPACVATYPGEGWKCLYGQYRIPFVRTPFLLSASQFDKYQLPYNEGVSPPFAPGPELQYADSFQVAVRDVMLQLPTTMQPGSAVYSSACFKHCVCIIGSFWGVKVNGKSLASYLADWYWGSGDPAAQQDTVSATAAVGGSNLPATMSPQWIESCSGFGDGVLGCGECHAKRASPEPPLPPSYGQSLVPGVRMRSPRAAARATDALMAALATTAGLLAMLSLCLCGCMPGGAGGGGGSEAKGGLSGVELQRAAAPPSAASPLLSSVGLDGRLLPRPPTSARPERLRGFGTATAKKYQW